MLTTAQNWLSVTCTDVTVLICLQNSSREFQSYKSKLNVPRTSYEEIHFEDG